MRRRMSSAWIAGTLGVGLTASIVLAQQASYPGRGPGSGSSGASGSAAEPPLYGAAGTRGARYLLRNGLDYIQYQQYERALKYLREAESQEKELTNGERQELHRGIEQAQSGLRAAADAATPYALSDRSGSSGRSGFAPAHRDTQDPGTALASARTRTPDRGWSGPVRSSTSGSASRMLVAADTPRGRSTRAAAGPESARLTPDDVAGEPIRLTSAEGDELARGPSGVTTAGGGMTPDGPAQPGAQPPVDPQSPGGEIPSLDAPGIPALTAIPTSPDTPRADSQPATSTAASQPAMPPAVAEVATTPEAVPGQGPAPQRSASAGTPAPAPIPVTAAPAPILLETPDSSPSQPAPGQAASTSTASSPSTAPAASAPSPGSSDGAAAELPALPSSTPDAVSLTPPADNPTAPAAAMTPSSAPATDGLVPAAMKEPATPAASATAATTEPASPANAGNRVPAGSETPASEPAPLPAAATEPDTPLPPLGADASRPAPASRESGGAATADAPATNPEPAPGTDPILSDLPTLPADLGRNAAATTATPAPGAAQGASVAVQPTDGAGAATPAGATDPALTPAPAGDAGTLPREQPTGPAPAASGASDEALPTLPGEGAADARAGATAPLPQDSSATPGQASPAAAADPVSPAPAQAAVAGSQDASSAEERPIPVPQPDGTTERGTDAAASPSPSAGPDSAGAGASAPTSNRVPGAAESSFFLPPRDTPSSTLRPDEERRVAEIMARQKQEELLRNQMQQGRQRIQPQGDGMGGREGSTSNLQSQTYDISRAPSPAEARPIKAIPVPEDWVPLAARDWSPQRKYFAAAATCHLPLYFQDAVLERYGHPVEQFVGPVGRFLSYPVNDPKQSTQRNQIIQPFFSAGLMALQIAAWPYNAIMDPPWEAQYDLGYYRPGDMVPVDVYWLPLRGYGPPLRGNSY